MGLAYRAFVCRRCGVSVLICRSCDRGHCYCSRECSAAARRESIKNARRRFERSAKGRAATARRHRRLYARRVLASENLTHQGSHPAPSSSTIEPAAAAGGTVTPRGAAAAVAPPPAAERRPRPGHRAAVRTMAERPSRAARPSIRRCHFCGRLLR